MGDNNSYVVPFVWDEKEENLFPTPNLPKRSSLSPESYDSQEGRSSSSQSSLLGLSQKKTPSFMERKGKKVAGADDFFPKHADYQLFPPRKEAHHDFFPDYQLFPPPPQPQPQQDQDFIPQQIKNYQLFPPQQEANHDFYQSTYQFFPPQSQQDGHHDFCQRSYQLFPPQSHQEGHHDFSPHHNYQLPPQQEPHHGQQVMAPPQQDPLHDFISHHVNYMQLPPPPPPPQPHRYLGDDDCSLFMQQQRRNTSNNSFFTDNIYPGSRSFF